MDTSHLLDALQRDGAAFRASAATAGLGADVVACPGWKVADLVWHLTSVHYFWATVVKQRVGSSQEVHRIDRVPDAQLLDAYDSHLARLSVVLTTNDPTDEVWTWSDDHSVAFVIRRMAQETAVHAWDVSSALGALRPIDPELASDGIDEFLTHFLDDMIEGAAPVAGSVHIHCGDVPGEWTIRPDGTDGFAVTREHAKGDCTLRGNASDLLLALWRRVGPESIDVVGDADVARRFLATANLD